MKKVHNKYNHKCRKTYPSHLAQFRFKMSNLAGSLDGDTLALSCILELFAIKITELQSGNIADEITSLQFDILPESPTLSSIAQVIHLFLCIYTQKVLVEPSR